MGLYNVLKQKYDFSLRKYNVAGKIEKLLNYNNVKLMAWAFIMSRVYRIYQLYREEMVLNDILNTVLKKQTEYIKNVKKISIDDKKLLKENNIYIDDLLNLKY